MDVGLPFSAIPGIAKVLPYASLIVPPSSIIIPKRLGPFSFKYCAIFWAPWARHLNQVNENREKTTNLSPRDFLIKPKSQHECTSWFEPSFEQTLDGEKETDEIRFVIAAPSTPYVAVFVRS